MIRLMDSKYLLIFIITYIRKEIELLNDFFTKIYFIIFLILFNVISEICFEYRDRFSVSYFYSSGVSDRYLLETLKEISMYLAIKEILQNKLRYSLILTTIFLIAFMVFFYDQFSSWSCAKQPSRY